MEGIKKLLELAGKRLTFNANLGEVEIEDKNSGIRVRVVRQIANTYQPYYQPQLPNWPVTP